MGQVVLVALLCGLRGGVLRCGAPPRPRVPTRHCAQLRAIQASKREAAKEAAKAAARRDAALAEQAAKARRKEKRLLRKEKSRGLARGPPAARKIAAARKVAAARKESSPVVVQLKPAHDTGSAPTAGRAVATVLRRSRVAEELFGPLAPKTGAWQPPSSSRGATARSPLRFLVADRPRTPLVSDSPPCAVCTHVEAPHAVNRQRSTSAWPSRAAHMSALRR